MSARDGLGFEGGARMRPRSTGWSEAVLTAAWTSTSCATLPAAAWPPRSTRSPREPRGDPAGGRRRSRSTRRYEAACELLGLDPLYVANEGKALIVLPVAHAQAALQLLHSLRYGEGSVQIGVVRATPAGRVLMRTAIGGTRVVDTLAGEMLPRIC